MSYSCYPREGLKTCEECPDRKECEVYMLIMDLTATRNICPIDPTLEECPVTGRRVPYELFERIQRMEEKLNQILRKLEAV